VTSPDILLIVKMVRQRGIKKKTLRKNQFFVTYCSCHFVTIPRRAGLVTRMVSIVTKHLNLERFSGDVIDELSRYQYPNLEKDKSIYHIFVHEVEDVITLSNFNKIQGRCCSRSITFWE